MGEAVCILQQTIAVHEYEVTDSRIVDSSRPSALGSTDQLRTRGTPIPDNDLWIAALARQHGLAVVSRDEHFDRLPQLVRRSWCERPLLVGPGRVAAGG